MSDKKQYTYKKLLLSYEVPEILDRTIDEFLEYLNTNTNKELSRDLYESEIRAILNGCDDFTSEQYWEICDYYVFKGIDNDRLPR